MKYDCIIGIDAGANGGIAYTRNGEVKAMAMPKNYDDFIDWLQYMKSICTPIVFLEKLSIRPDDVRVEKDTANLGKLFRIKNMMSNYEQLKAAVKCCHIDLAEVHPRTWQSRLNLNYRGIEKPERKRLYKERAAKIYPQLKPTLKTADAILIMQFGVRTLQNDLKWLKENLQTNNKLL